MDLNLTGQSVLVTGGSRGIGLAIARAFAAEGCRLQLSSRDAVALEAAKDDIIRQFSVQVDFHRFDLAEPGAADRLAADAGDVDILVNCAGAIPQSTLLGISEDEWRKAWELKVFGYINLSRSVYRRMVSRRSGVIINIVGIAGEHPAPAYIVGCSGNAALLSFSQALGVESVNHCIRVIAINPGATETDRQMNRWKARAKTELGDERCWRELTTGFPFGRLAKPGEIADVVAFMASERAGYVSGAVITVDGGAGFRREQFSGVGQRDVRKR